MTAFRIEAEHLGKTFKTSGTLVHAVRDISLQVHVGELFGLFGHNGAGKSTLIRMLATLVRPTRGHASVNGFDLVRDERRVRASIGLVASDERSFYGRLSGADNLRFFAALQNVPQRQIDRRVVIVLDLFDLAGVGGRPVQTYSTGQRQRLNMARAVLHDPPVLFLDEPTKSMDVQTSDFVKTLVKKDLVGRQGKTIVYISHELYEMENFCDRVAVIHHGELRALGTPHELQDQLPVRPAYELQIGGDVERALCALCELDMLSGVNVSDRSNSTATVSVQLRAAGESWAWQARLAQAVVDAGGHLTSLQPLGGRSLRDVVRYFSGDEQL